MSSNHHPIGSALNAKPTLFDLTEGLYLVRLMPPVSINRVNPVALSQLPVGNAKVDFLSAPGVPESTLIRINDCMIVRVMQGTATLMAAELYKDTALSVRLEIERIGLPKEETAVSRSVAAIGSPMPVASIEEYEEAQAIDEGIAQEKDVPPISVRMVGHIQSVGDVVAQDNWLGDPDDNNRLEGFAIRPDGLPDSVRLVYGCKLKATSTQPQITNEGKFVGSRRKAMGIQSVVFGLDGEGADEFELAGEAVFSGQCVREIVPVQELRGPTGNEHLVAIYLEITPKRSKVAQAFDEERASSQDDEGVWTDEDIADIFRR